MKIENTSDDWEGDLMPCAKLYRYRKWKIESRGEVRLTANECYPVDNSPT